MPLRCRELRRACGAVILLLSCHTARAEEFPGWAFPFAVLPAPATARDTTRPVSVPGSSVHFTDAELHRRSDAPDWFPSDHPPAPDLILHSHSDKKFACGLCHLPNGGGRAENVRLAGLSAAYIIEQVKAFRTRNRRAAQPNFLPMRFMIETVQDLTDEEIAAAADYYSRLAPRSFVRVLERSTVPQHEASLGIMLPLPGRPVPLGARIVEMPADVERFEHRDPYVGYNAYVPKGSIERGRRLATNRTTACATCHGTGLKGGPDLPGPPIAGQFPTYLFRQLYSFQSGARTGEVTAPMQSVVASLTQANMIDLAAYVASLKP